MRVLITTMYNINGLCSLFRYQVMVVTPKTNLEVEYLAKLQDSPFLDFWTDIGLNRPVHIMVVPQFRLDVFKIHA